MEFLRRAMQRLESVLDQEWRARAKRLPYKNAYEALIMASIIEKETGQASERDEIAGVFVRRLKYRHEVTNRSYCDLCHGQRIPGQYQKKGSVSGFAIQYVCLCRLTSTPSISGARAITAALHPKKERAYILCRKVMAVIIFRHPCKNTIAGQKISIKK